MNRIILLSLLFLPTIMSAQFFMYSGDTNNDGVANYIDVLPIGLAYQAEGPPREIPTNNWIQQEFFQFGQTLPFTGVEYGFIDCDGNGFIDSLDIESIFLNYDSTQNNANPPPIPYEPTDTLFTTDIPEIVVSFEIDTAFVSDTIYANIDILYPDSLALNPILGAALGLEYDPEFVLDSLTVIFPDTIADDLMFVTAASNFSSFYRLPNEGRLEIGAAGRGQNSINGSRRIATARIIIEDQIIRSGGEKPFYFSLTDIILLNDQEQVFEANFFSDTLLLLDTVVGIYEPHFSDKIKIYPNPARDFMIAESRIFSISEIVIYNQLGQIIHSEAIEDRHKFRVSVQHLPTGIYFMGLRTQHGFAIKKMVISG